MYAIQLSDEFFKPSIDCDTNIGCNKTGYQLRDRYYDRMKLNWLLSPTGIVWKS